MKVFVVEDSAAVRERIVRLLRRVPHFELAGVAETAEEAVVGVARSRPQVVTLDLGLRVGHGLQVLRAIKGMTPMPVVIALTINASPQCRQRCLDAGADFFFSKTAEFGKVVDALLALAGRGADAATARQTPRSRKAGRNRGGAPAPVRFCARAGEVIPTPGAPSTKARP